MNNNCELGLDTECSLGENACHLPCLIDRMRGLKILKDMMVSMKKHIETGSNEKLLFKDYPCQNEISSEQLRGILGECRGLYETEPGNYLGVKPAVYQCADKLDAQFDVCQGVLNKIVRKAAEDTCRESEKNKGMCFMKMKMQASMFDIASFKGFNDNFSMAVGDMVIDQFRDYLNAKVGEMECGERECAKAFNLNGDEYFVFFGVPNRCPRRSNEQPSELPVPPRFAKDIAAEFAETTITIVYEDRKFQLHQGDTEPVNKPFFILKKIKMHYGHGASKDAAEQNLKKNKAEDKPPERGDLHADMYLSKSDADSGQNTIKPYDTLMYFVKGFKKNPALLEPVEEALNAAVFSAYKKAVIALLSKTAKDVLEYFSQIDERSGIPDGMKTLLAQVKETAEKLEEALLNTEDKAEQHIANLLTALENPFNEARQQTHSACGDVAAMCTNSIWTLTVYKGAYENVCVRSEFVCVTSGFVKQNDENSRIFRVEIAQDAIHVSRVKDVRNGLKEKLAGKDKEAGEVKSALTQLGHVVKNIHVSTCDGEIWPVLTS